MKILQIITAILLLSSCKVTEGQRREICAHCPVKDSVSYVTKTEVKYKDTTIYITQQGPIQYLENPCKLLCDSLGNLKKFLITKKENGIIGTIKSVGNTIVFDCKADSMAKVIEALTKIIEESKTKEQTKTLPPVVTNELTKLQGFWIISSQIFWLIVLIFGGYKAVKFYLNFKKLP